MRTDPPCAACPSHGRRRNSIAKLKVAFLSLAALLVAGCTGWLVKPEAPHIALTHVRLAKLSLTQPELELELALHNPNEIELKVRRIDFTVAFGGRDFAYGHSDQGFVIPKHGAASVAVRVVAEIAEVFQQLNELSASPEPDFGYVMRGRIRLARWPVPIPFLVSGNLLPDDRPS